MKVKCVRRKLFVLFLLTVLLFLFTAAYAAEEQQEKGALARFWERLRARYFRQETVPQKEAEVKLPQKEAAKQPSQEKKEMPSKRKMIDTIERRLEVFPEIIDTMPGLQQRKTTLPEGVEYYYTPPGGIAMQLKELDKETLYRLYVKVNQQSTIIHTQRITRQLRQQEQLRRLQQMQRIPKPPATPPQAPPRPPQLPPSPPVPPPDRR